MYVDWCVSISILESLSTNAGAIRDDLCLIQQCGKRYQGFLDHLPWKGSKEPFDCLREKEKSRPCVSSATKVQNCENPLPPVIQLSPISCSLALNCTDGGQTMFTRSTMEVHLQMNVVPHRTRKG
jgi:hypothetical protein